MILGEAQPFASPEEALVHYGVKGMKWGVRKERTPVDRKRRAKKAAVGVTAVTLAAGAGFVAFKLSQSGSAPISAIKQTQDELRVAKSFVDAAGGGSEAQKYAEMFLKNTRGF